MVVHHSRSLHMGITNGGAYELKAPLPKVFAQEIRFGAGSRVIAHVAKFIGLGVMVHEFPDIGREAAKLLLDLEESLSIIDGRSDFCLVTDDSGIFH